MVDMTREFAAIYSLRIRILDNDPDATPSREIFSFFSSMPHALNNNDTFLGTPAHFTSELSDSSRCTDQHTVSSSVKS